MPSFQDLAQYHDYFQELFLEAVDFSSKIDFSISHTSDTVRSVQHHLIIGMTSK